MFIKNILLLLLTNMMLHAGSGGVCFDRLAEDTFGESIAYYKDSSGKLDPFSIMNLPQKAFIKAEHFPSYLGMSFKAPMLWGRFTAIERCSKQNKIYLFIKNITMKNVRLFVEVEGRLDEIEKIQDVHAFVFALPLRDYKQNFFFQIQGDGPYIVDATFHSEAQLASALLKDLWFFAIFSGLLLSVGLFFMIFFMITGHRVYLYFSLHILSHMVLWLSIFGVAHVFFPMIDMSVMKFASVVLSTIFLLLLGMNFLQLDKYLPRFNKVMIILIVVMILYYLLGKVLSILPFFPPFVGLLKFALYLMLLSAIVASIRLKIKGAWYFLFGVTAYALGNFTTIVGIFLSGALPVNSVTLNAGMMGIVIDILFISVVLALGVKQLNNEKNRLLRDYNESLKKEVELRTKEIERHNVLLQKLSTTDALTQLSNRLELDTLLMTRFEKYDNACDYYEHIIMIDADNFKSINDSYGHLIGDEMLKRMASIIKKSLKEEDVIGRWGGEEFMVLSQTHSSEEIADIAERIRKNIGKDQNKYGIKLTVSAGIATLKQSDSLEDWIHSADEALYRAKAKGRNRVEYKEQGIL